MTDKQNFGTLLLLVLAPIPIQPTTSSFLTKRRKKPVFPPKYFPNVLKYMITNRWHNQITFFVQVWDGAGMADSLRIPPDGQVRESSTTSWLTSPSLSTSSSWLLSISSFLGVCLSLEERWTRGRRTYFLRWNYHCVFFHHCVLYLFLVFEGTYIFCKKIILYFIIISFCFLSCI